jgi:hypothetical protein
MSRRGQFSATNRLQERWRAVGASGEKDSDLWARARAMARQAYECATLTVTVEVAVRLPASETLTQ